MRRRLRRASRHRAFSASTSEKGELHTLCYVMTVLLQHIRIYILISYYGVYPQKCVKIFLPLRLYYLFIIGFVRAPPPLNARAR